MPRPSRRAAYALLDDVYGRYHRVELMGIDPVSRVHRFSKPEDVEIAGLVAAALAYGRVASVVNSVDKVLAALGPSPYDTLKSFDRRRDGKRLAGFVHRFTTAEDMTDFLQGVAHLVGEYGSVKNAFLAGDEAGATIDVPMAAFTARLREGIGKSRHANSYLWPTPGDGSACKRYNLFLRWMARPDDGVDFGLWPEVGAHRLVMPLDVHVARICRALGLLQRKSNDWKAACEVTAHLRKLCPEDPIRYDFAITHIGITGRWKELLKTV
ncbi:MAG: TIGR02757 family protein [Deltaproteobacteria bacterium]|nr:TIGR02757 family protein [bacterium]MCB9476593.1 TIGR02757 family protein [Deltaproteobacteria bacterium]MCB9487988.1 TIGR02757 family protein [Deltaproteobacteria bacterium]